MRGLLVRLVRRLNALPEPTAAGRITLLFLLVGFWFPVARHNNPALFVFCAVLATILLSALVTHFATARLSVARRLPRRVFSGAPFDVRLRLTNRSRWRPALGIGFRDALQVDDPGDLICGPEVPVLPPRATVEVSYRKRLHRRGVRTITSTLAATRFPFGLFEKKVLLESAKSRIVVLPALGRLQRAAERDLRQHVADPRPRRHQRDGMEEFQSIREFAHGDNPKHIHWKTSARTGKLMRRVMRDDAGEDLVIILDTFVGGLRARERRHNLEKAVSCAATLLVDAARRGTRAVVRFPGGEARHSGHMREVLPALEALALLRGSDVRAADFVPRMLSSRSSRVLLLSLAGTARRARAAARGRRVHLHVWNTADPAFARYFRKR